MQRKNLLDAFLTPQQFAAALGVTTSTVLRWSRLGELPSVRLGRQILIPRDALERLMARTRPEGSHGV